MSEVIVIVGASEMHGTLPLYLKQLSEAGIDTHIHDCSDKPNINGGGNLEYRVRKFRDFALEFRDYQFMVISDAFDVTFYGTKADLIAKIPHGYLLHAAEKNCYPPECHKMPIPDAGPHRYANGGIVAGTPEAFLAWCKAAEQHPHYNPGALDQWFLNLLVAEGSPLGVIDSKTDLFYCLFGGYEELGFVNGLPQNDMYATRPQFLHANGKWTADEMFARHQRSLA